MDNKEEKMVLTINGEVLRKGTINGEVLRKGLRSLWVIWAALLASLVIYVFICHFLGAEIGANADPDFPMGLFKKILYVVALATFGLAYFLRRLMVSGRFSGSQGSLVNPAVPSSQPPYLAKYTIAVVVSLALSESIGIYGLVLFFLGQDFQTLYTFIAISALAMIFFRPKMEELERLASTAKTVS
jgi:F0F1-type ATP synthase membrane subunit c/vacuolar-type H+-ATPase subunit K